MRGLLITAAAAGGITLLGLSSAETLPLSGEAIKGAVEESSVVQNVGLFHVKRTSRRVFIRGLRTRHACHFRQSSRVKAGRC